MAQICGYSNHIASTGCSLATNSTEKVVDNLILSFSITAVSSTAKVQNDMIIEGLATRTEDDTLEECQLNFLANLDYSDAINEVKPCIENNLCTKFGVIRQDHILMAQVYPYDFGRHTVLYAKLLEAFPNLKLSKRGKRSVADDMQVTEQSELQNTLNDLVDTLLAGAVSFLSQDELGTYRLPDFSQVLKRFFGKNGLLVLADGQIRGLEKVHRPEDVDISAEGFRYTLKVTAKIPDAYMDYKNFSLEYGFVNRNGDVKIDIKSIALAMQVIANYNTIPCSIKIEFIRPNVEGVNFEMTGGGLTDVILNNAINLAVNTFISTIVSSGQSNVEELIKKSTKSFDCEKHRPRMK